MTLSVIINLILIGVLVLVTGYYAWQAHRQANLLNQQTQIMLNSQFNAAAPVISLEANQSNPGFIRVYFLNVGKGPAFNFRCWVEDPEHPELRVTDQALLRTILPEDPSNSKQYSDIKITGEYKLGVGYIRAQYESIFGKTYESSLMFPSNVSPQLEWGEAQEIVRI